MVFALVSFGYIRKGIAVISVALLVALLVSACGENNQIQQQTRQSKTALDQALSHAQNIGVPASILKSIVDQEQALDQTTAPVTVLSAEPVNDYYTNLSQRYQMLTVQTLGLETQATQQLDYQATQDVQSFATILAQRQAQGFIEAKIFANQLAQDQNLMAQAQYPKHYLQISASARDSARALFLMGPAYDKMTTLNNVAKQLAASHLDVTVINQEAQYDLDLFRSASKPADFQNIIDQVNAQLQTTAALSTQAIPYVGAAKLQQFSADINLMQTYGMDVSHYQQHLNTDLDALHKAHTLNDFLTLSSQIDNDVTSIQFPMLQGEASYLLKQLHQEVMRWGNNHRYHDALDGFNYELDYEYDQQGIGSDADAALQSAQTPDDYQAVVDLINNDTVHLQAMEADYADSTPANQTHAADLQLMKHYNLQSGQVIVVSLVEQALRLYQDGKVVHSFLITSGQYERPSVPGYWHIFLRQSPTVFKSSEPKGSAFWYPDTNIHFAMEYHDGGYFFHDSWWRINYGPGTNFPHIDSGGDQSFAGNGSHGCINMPEQEAGWLYQNTGYDTAVLIY